VGSLYNDDYDQSKPWFDQPKNFGRGYKLKAPYDNIIVGCDPTDGMTKETADSYDAIINVSSTRCATFEPSRPDQRTYWFPIIEMGRWPIVYFLWLKEVMDFHYSKGHKIYLHCHAGAFRSPSAALLWLESKGHTREEALVINNDKSDGIYRIQENQGNINIKVNQLWKVFNEQQAKINERGYGTLNIESAMHYDMPKDIYDHETMSGKHRIENIKRHWFWFYYKPLYWLKDKKSKFKEWAFERRGRITTGLGSSYGYRRKYFWARMEKAEPMDSMIAGEWSWYNGRWNKVKEWEKQPNGKYDYRWLVEKCSTCDGRGVTIDKSKPFGQGHAHCEVCKRTGVKL